MYSINGIFYFNNQTESKAYSMWKIMKRKCNNPNDLSYKNFGAKGIVVCPHWNEFKYFYDWVLSKGYTEEEIINCKLSRIDKNYHFCPSNCVLLQHRYKRI